MKSYASVLLVLAATGLVACSDEDPVAVDRTVAPLAAVTAVPGVREVVGETGPGAQYALLVPANWNGELVVYAHGYVQPFIEPSLVMEIAPFRDFLLSQGFAVAYSGWSETGYAVKDGAQRTHQLNGLFASEFGQPTRTYLVGLSLGGLVADQLAERFSGQYDGTLALCGVMAGGQWNASYVADFRLLFDVFYPGVLPGSLLEMPAGAIVAPGTPLYNAIVTALITNPYPAIDMARMEQVQLRYNDIGELITAFVHVLGYQVNGANALTERLNGKSFHDNSDTRYSGSSKDAFVNATIARFEADPAASSYFEHSWNPTGRIGAPMLTLHTTRDPLVPERGEQIFADTVAAAGNAELLLQRTTNAFGHCAFTGPDLAGAFFTLRNWVVSGVRPAA